jgi:hypothetical protein
MPINRNQALLTFKEEAIYNTPPASPYTPLLILKDPEISPLVADRLERGQAKPWFGADRKRLVNKRVTMTFSVEDGGSGVVGTAPAYGPLLLACRFTETIVTGVSVTYSLVSTGIKSLTMRWVEKDVASGQAIQHQFSGAYGTATFIRNSGEYPRIDFEFQGVYSQPTDIAFAAATYANQGLAVEVNSTNTPLVTINSVACCMSEFEVALNNDLVFSNRAGCTEKFSMTGSNPEGRIQVEDKLIAGQNFWTLAESDLTYPIVVGHTGGTAGTKSTITVGKADIYEPSFATLDNGTRFINLPFAPISTDGTSEMSIAYT